MAFIPAQSKNWELEESTERRWNVFSLLFNDAVSFTDYMTYFLDELMSIERCWNDIDGVNPK